MSFAARLVSFSLVHCFTVFIASMRVPSTSELRCPGFRPASCNCSKTSYGYELRCSTFTLQVQEVVVQIQCNTNEISDFSVLNGLYVLNLTFINVENKNIVLTKAMFCSVPKLQELQLSSNNVTYLETGVFYSLIYLKWLKLWGNMRNFSRAVFSDVDNLESLNIVSNEMNTLPSDLFADLSKLRKINFQTNDFISLPQNLFISNPELQTIIFQHNRRTLKTLPSKLFGNLTKLKEVTLKYCNISTLPEDLLWGSTSINTIVLNNNAFATFPDELFKDCVNLQTLDLSFNQITDLPVGLFSQTMNMEVLKSNNNQLTVITDLLFSSLKKLKVLDLKDNRLTHIEIHAFSMLKSLETLNISNNMLETIQDNSNKSLWLLEFCRNLQDVQLANNSLTALVTDWHNFDYLETINLANNKISRIRTGDLQFSTSHFWSHIFVDISYNIISEIDFINDKTVYVHKYATRLYDVPVRIFYIKGNPINCDCKVYRLTQYDGSTIIAKFIITTETESDNLKCVDLEAFGELMMQDIPTKYFSCLGKTQNRQKCPEQCSCIQMFSNKLLRIDCHQEDLASITPGEKVMHNFSRALFSDLHNLSSLDIISTKMKSLPVDLFGDLIELQEINLYANEFINLPQNLFINNTKLKRINLRNNGKTIKMLPSRLLADIIELIEVKIESCNISSLPEDLLWGSTSIYSISLNSNAFTTFPVLLFRDCKELHTLDISFNWVTDLPGSLFSEMKNLEILKLNNNQLTVITDYLFSNLSNLKVLDLKDNRLTHIETYAFATLSALKALNMSNNVLTFEDILKNRTNNSSPLKFCEALQDIQLANNSLTKIFTDWRHLKNLVSLNLAYNQISQIQALDLHFFGTKDTSVYLRYNNISEINIFDAETVYKYVPESKKYDVPARHIFVDGNPINCDCKTHSLVQYIADDITAHVIFLMETIPGNLQCVKPKPHIGQMIDSIPIKPFICLLKKEYNSDCPKQCSCLLRISDKALLVDCNQRNQTLMPNVLPDIEFSNYTELTLYRNRIKSIKSPLGPGYYKVTKYNLSENNISEIDLTAFSTKLQVLEVYGNSINQFNSLSLEFLINATYLRKLTLHNNPWKCDCTTKNFIIAMRSNSHFIKISTLDKATCENGKEILKILDTEICPVEPIIVVSQSYLLGALGLLFGLLIGFVFAVYYKYQKGIKVWLFAHRYCLWFVNEEELDRDKIYDAFVSYSHHDESFVEDHLLPGLEDGPIKYTLCLHHRDWLAGEFIAAQIATSVEESRRTIIVLSPAFLDSVWGRMEFCAAHKQALSERRIRVIVILLEDIGPTDNLDSELRTYLTMNTYVKWGDSSFWDKLRYAMPHTSKQSTSIPLQEKV